jgi:hypothetical protein
VLKQVNELALYELALYMNPRARIRVPATVQRLPALSFKVWPSPIRYGLAAHAIDGGHCGALGHSPLSTDVVSGGPSETFHPRAA